MGASRAIRSQLLRTYPALWDVPVTERWSGPIDYSLSGLPFFVRLREAPSVLVCAGFSGDGVGPSRLAGEILAELVADGGSAGLPGALRSVPSRPMPPEPIRYVGGRLVRGAIARKEHSEDLGLKAADRRSPPRRARSDRLRLQRAEARVTLKTVTASGSTAPTNSEIAAAFDELGDLYELDGASIHRIVAYRNGARAVREASKQVAQLALDGEATKLPGIGATLQEKIVALTTTGEIPALVKLRSKFPPGLVEMTRLPGLGPKRARRLYEELGLDSLDALQQAATAGQISELKGFGPKAEQALLEAVAEYAQAGPAQRIVLSRALAVGEELLAEIRALTVTERAELAGSARRMGETVKDLDIVATASDPGALAAAVAGLPQVEAASTPGPNAVRIRTHSGISVDVRIVEPDQFGNVLQHLTGSKQHNVALRDFAVRRGMHVSEYGVLDDNSGMTHRCATEAEVYALLGMDYIEPELREDRGELEAALKHALPELVTAADLKGDLHCHTTASDGTASIEEMAQAAIDAGYEYLVITDHSASMGFGADVSSDQLRHQIERVREVDATLDGFHAAGRLRGQRAARRRTRLRR